MFLEWTDPPFAPGHWIPEMIELAGGEPLLATPGEKSRRVDLGRRSTTPDPDVVVVAPCGFDRDGCRRAGRRPRRQRRAAGRRTGARRRRQRLLGPPRHPPGRRRRGAGRRPRPARHPRVVRPRTAPSGTSGGRPRPADQSSAPGPLLAEPRADDPPGKRSWASRPPYDESPSTMSPPRRRASSRTIASPRPLPPVSRSRASSSRAKRSKTRSRSAGGMPGPSSATATARPARRRTPERQVDAGAGVAPGVVDQVAHDALELEPAHRQGAVGQVTDRDHAGGSVAANAGEHHRRIGRRVGGRAAASPASSRASTRRSSTSARQPDELGIEVGAVLVGRAVPPRDVDLDAQRGQRAAQLVGDVGHEAALAVPGGREPVEHRVERDGQGVDLVARLRHRAAARRARHPTPAPRPTAATRPAAAPRRSPATRSARAPAAAAG